RLIAPALAGSFTPRPHRRALFLERRRGGEWRKVTRIRTTRAGRYRVQIDRSGVYRVRAGRISGPSVRVP
ncbi:MAG: hypothetical protein ACRDLD_13735, partial [Thermoleophilaceae bacterium]